MASSAFLLKIFGPLANITSYHVMLYGTLLGTELYQVFLLLSTNDAGASFRLMLAQSFVMTRVCFEALPMSAFTTLQKRVFPLYFRLQSLLLVLTAVTHPPYGPVSLAASPGDLIPMALAGAMAALNTNIYGPRTQEAMIERIHQGRVHILVRSEFWC